MFGKVIVLGNDIGEVVAAITEQSSNRERDDGTLYSYQPIYSGETIPLYRVRKAAGIETLGSGLVGGDVVGLIFVGEWKRNRRYARHLSEIDEIRSELEQISREDGRYFVKYLVVEGGE